MIRRTLHRLLHWAWDYEESLTKDKIEYVTAKLTSTSERESARLPNGINFEVIPAQGGCVIHVHHYNRKQDEIVRHLHVLHDGETFDEQLTHIISMERLRA